MVLGLLAVVVVYVMVPGHGSRAPTGTSTSSSSSGVAIDPSAFSTGACVAMAPTHGNRHRTVFLDAGHGGRDVGAVGTTESGATVYEADLTLPVELDTASVLRADGFRVVVSRTANTSVVQLTPADVSGTVLSLQGAHDDVVARDVCANDAHAQVLVGIYFDSGGSPDNAGSLTAYDTARPFAAANEQFATVLQTDVLDAMNARGWQIPNAGVTSDANVGSLVETSQGGAIAAEAAAYGHLLLLGPPEAGYQPNPSSMPGAVIEPLFLTDPFEASIAASASGQSVIARGIATAVEQYLAPPATAKGTDAATSARSAATASSEPGERWS